MHKSNKPNATNYIIPKCDKFNSYAMKINEHNVTNNNHDQYVLEQQIIRIKEPQKVPKKNELQEEGKKDLKIMKQSQEVGKCLISELSYPIHLGITNIRKCVTNTEYEESDFTEIWDEIESIHEKNMEQTCIENRTKLERTEKNTYEAGTNKPQNYQNTCENENKQSENIFEENSQELESESWGSWTEIVEQLEKEHEKKKEMGKSFEHSNNCFEKTNNEQSQELGDVCETMNPQVKHHEDNENMNETSTNEYKNGIVEFEETKGLEDFEDSEVFGPFKFNIEYYDIYGKFNIKRVQELEIEENSNKFGQNELKIIGCANKNLRKINWEIQQQRKEEAKMNKNGKILLSEHGKDFCISDHVKFLTNSSLPDTRLYFGIRSFNNSSSNCFEKENKHIEIKDYLYLSSTGECLLETIHHQLENLSSFDYLHKFDIIQSLTLLKIGCCERTIKLQKNNKVEQSYVRRYDPSLQCECEYLGMIESKISKINAHYFCDITIYIPKTKVYHKEDLCKYSEELLFKVSRSENESVLVSLGICHAINSITNCKLFNENNTIEFMMATIDEQVKELSFITHFSGISPLMGFAAAVSRQLFVSYPKL